MDMFTEKKYSYMISIYVIFPFWLLHLCDTGPLYKILPVQKNIVDILHILWEWKVIHKFSCNHLNIVDVVKVSSILSLKMKGFKRTIGGKNKMSWCLEEISYSYTNIK